MINSALLLNLFSLCSLLSIYKTFSCNLFLTVYIMLFLYDSKLRYCTHWKTWWKIFAYFCCSQILRIVFTSIINFYYTFWICINNKWCLLRFVKYWFNSNILVPLKEFITLETFLFSHTFLSRASFFFLLWKNEGNSDNKNRDDF